MIIIPTPLFRRIVDAAERTYPEECCGLLVGHEGQAAHVFVIRVAPSANVAPGSKRDRFEIDPKVRFDLMRELSGGPEAIVGHYHSHPDHPAEPSRRDVERAWEPALVWLITSVSKGQAVRTAAFRIDGANQRYHEMMLRVSDGPRPLPSDPHRGRRKPCCPN